MLQRSPSLESNHFHTRADLGRGRWWVSTSRVSESMVSSLQQKHSLTSWAESSLEDSLGKNRLKMSAASSCLFISPGKFPGTCKWQQYSGNCWVCKLYLTGVQVQQWTSRWGGWHGVKSWGEGFRVLSNLPQAKLCLPSGVPYSTFS